MEEKGIICRKSNDSITINILPDIKTCKNCKLKSSCAENNSDERILTLNIKNIDSYSIGDRVLIYLPPNKSILFSVLIFLLPAILFITEGYILSMWIKDILAFILSAVYAILYYTILTLIQKKFSKNIKIKKFE